MMRLQNHYSGFHGKLLRSRQANGLFLTETSYPPGLKLSKHAHEYAHFCLVLQGAFRDDDDRVSRSCASLSVIFRPAGANHSDEFFGHGGRCLNIEIEPPTLDHVRDCARLPDSPVAFRNGLLAALISRAYGEFRTSDGLSELAIEALVLEMLVEVSRCSATDYVNPQWLKRARELIQARFAEPLSLHEIAGAVGVNPAHLAREFHHSYRLTVGDYIRQLRIDFACSQLSKTNARLSEIAVAAGFYDQSHLTRTFKRLIGLTPGDYRRQMAPR